MTKQMEDFFNLPVVEKPVIIETPKPVDQIMVDANSVYSALSTAEKVDFALPTVNGINEHDTDMDEISQKAIQTFEDLISLGSNVPDMHAGKIYEVAGQMLKTALEAKNAKADRKLKMIELQLKKVRSEQIDFENGLGNGVGKQATQEFDRNELLRYIISAKIPEVNK